MRVGSGSGARAGIVVVVLVLSACSVTLPGTAASPGQLKQKPAAWVACGGGFQCSTLTVPLDYANPAGRKIPLALIRLRASGRSNRLGSILINPGGPGASGLDFLRNSVELLSNVNRRFDLVSWDPRGVGKSEGIDCGLSGMEKDRLREIDPVLDDPFEKLTYMLANANVDAQCERASGWLLPFMDTETNARDMDRIRAAVGDSKLTYMGFSYGTYLGQWYAHLFPSRVRALALDGVVNPLLADDDLSGLVGLQRSLDAFLAYCASHTKCGYGRSGALDARLEAALSRLEARPLTLGSRKLTSSMVLGVVLGGLYDPSDWDLVGGALVALDKGDGSTLLMYSDNIAGRRSDGTYSNPRGVGAATACIDGTPARTDMAFYDSFGPALVKASPIIGPYVQYGNLICAYWPVKASGRQPSPIEGTPPILLVGATGDPATPYEWAQAVTRQIPGSILLTRVGYGHTSYHFSACVRAAEDAYLIDLTVPDPGSVCSH